MKQHPTNEQWMEFLYDELPKTQKRALQDHLDTCAQCREQHATFSRTARSLDSWQLTLPAQHPFARNWAPALKWAAAAAILVTTAFATGRFSRPEIDLQQLQAKVAKPIQQDLERELATKMQQQLEAMRQEAERSFADAVAANQKQIEQLARTIAVLREEDRQVISASLKQLETQQVVEYRKLRKNLETVAVLTDQSLKDAQRKLVQLASYTTTPNQ